MPPHKIVKPGSKACVACRSKHLKCDGNEPCNRCVSRGSNCVFIASRRGENMKTIKSKYNSSEAYTPSNGSITEIERTLDQITNIQQQHFSDLDSLPLTSISKSLTSNIQPDVCSHDLILAYYDYIHPSHSFVFPRQSYLRNPQLLPTHLKLAMQFSASHVAPHLIGVSNFDTNAIYQSDVPNDGFKVQTLLILTMTHLARFEQDAGEKALEAAISLTRRLQFNPNVFNVDSSALSQESWVRTCAELHTISSLITLFTKIDNRYDFPADMILPGPCEEYQNGIILRQRTHRQMQDRLYINEEYTWSSFAYEIDATRILNEVLDMDPYETSSTVIEALDASITSFLLSIPTKRREMVYKTNTVDEKMFSALMIINLAAIVLHLPRSGLSAAQMISSCQLDQQRCLKVHSFDQHRDAVIKTANIISRMLASRRTDQSFSPCFTCGVALCVAVQLPAFLEEKDNKSAKLLRENIQLALAVLNRMGDHWPVAKLVKSQLAQISQAAMASVEQQLRQNSMLQPPRPLLDMYDTEDDAWLHELMNTPTEFSLEA